MKRLVIAEKPSVGREYAKALNCHNKNKGYFEGDKYIVSWALGHLVTLAQPDHYHKKYSQWNMDDLPMLPESMDIVVIGKTRFQYEIIKKILHRKDVTEIIIGTDAGREGELVARWILKKAKVNKPIKRLWISSQTEKAIKQGFNNLKDGKDYYNLYLSAVCRSEADWLVGLNVTRAMTCKHNASLSAGRVQTPTLSMIVKKEEEIRKFKPVEFFRIQVKYNGMNFTWCDNNNNSRINSKELAEKKLEELKKSEFIIESVIEKNKNTPPPQAYDLTELQRDGSRRYDYSPSKTLKILQGLYEHHKIVTYPRTDSKYITTDIGETITERLKAVNITAYSEFTQPLLNRKLNLRRSFVDNNKVSDHHAIIPTEQNVYIDDLNQDEKRIFDLIVSRFLAVLMDDFEYREIVCSLKCGNNILRHKGNIVVKQGWKKIYGDYGSDFETENSFGNFKKGEKIRVDMVNLNSEFTKPPTRYTDASLLTDMEDPSKFTKDEKMKSMLKESGGLGTPATRADIIEKLFNSYYVEKRGKSIHPTSKGEQIVKITPGELVTPELTAMWEMKLKKIADGKLKSFEFISEIRKYATELVKSVKSSNVEFTHDNVSRTKCPDCEKYLLEVNGKHGKIHVCPDRNCGYKNSLTRKSFARCPECKKRMEMTGSGDNQLFVCVCGFKEKLSSFKKRKEKDGKNMNKKEVRTFLKKQKNVEEMDSNPFADLLKGFKPKN